MPFSLSVRECHLSRNARCLPPEAFSGASHTRPMRILVVGASGYVGARVVPAARGAGPT